MTKRRKKRAEQSMSRAPKATRPLLKSKSRQSDESGTKRGLPTSSQSAIDGKAYPSHPSGAFEAPTSAQKLEFFRISASRGVQTSKCLRRYRRNDTAPRRQSSHRALRFAAPYKLKPAKRKTVKHRSDASPFFLLYAFLCSSAEARARFH